MRQLLLGERDADREGDGHCLHLPSHGDPQKPQSRGAVEREPKSTPWPKAPGGGIKLCPLPPPLLSGQRLSDRHRWVLAVKGELRPHPPTPAQQARTCRSALVGLGCEGSALTPPALPLAFLTHGLLEVWSTTIYKERRVGVGESGPTLS